MGVPDRVGRYRVVRLLGTGASSSVFLARDDELDAEVAIKVLAENLARREDLVARFLAQARTLRGINDPHVIGVHDVGMLENGQPYFVMDVAPGPTLDQGVDLDAPELAAAVGALHELGLVHGDIKPGNVFVATDGHLVLADPAFDGTGTPGYMPPEQERGEPIDQRADVYACTALLRKRHEKWPKRFDRFFDAGLASDPERRPADMDAWLAAYWKTGGFRGFGWVAVAVGIAMVAVVVTIVLLTTGSGSNDPEYTADPTHHRVLKDGEPFAGTGEPGDGGDGGPALNAQLNRPSDVAPAADGTVYIADTANNRVRAVDANGTIRTVAGTGVDGDGGDGDAATEAQLSAPSAVKVLPDGRVLITSGGRLRAFEPGGVITAYDGG